MSIENNNLTIRKLIKSLNNDSDDLFEWLYWPPNMFALTSIILQRTGAYRICLIETEENEWNFIHRNPIIESESEAWIYHVGSLLLDENYKFNPFGNIDIDEYLTDEGVFEPSFNLIKDKYLDFDLTHLRLIVSDPLENFDESYQAIAKDSRKLAVAIVNLHCLADMACATVGMVKEDYSENLEINMAITYANILLTATGSLSTLDKLNGIVLPKFRTPQQGQTLRALSLHLTYHLTETEIVWRTIPWLETTEKSINILSVPFPYKIKSKEFDAVPEKGHPTRYFKIRINEFAPDRLAILHSVVDKLIEMRVRISRIHILVLPELALTKSEYDYLLLLLYKKREEIHYLPIVITGVLSQIDNKNLDNDNIYHNEVKIANYFAGRWYDINQRKHHRWKLDKNQLVQYQISSKLSTKRNWYEYTSSSQRKLTIFSPNYWLSITALICEDLARLEPVSDVIRGVGPTLLFALLSDGPQLSYRWSARYATVFAEDPGTSVFSLTSLGMAKRAVKKENAYNEEENTKHTIGLWKDSENSQQEININESNEKDKKKAILMTLTAKNKTEHTIDGRSDNGFAPEFSLDNYFPITLNLQEHDEAEKLFSEQKKYSESFSEKIGDWNDIREISILFYSLDNIINTRGQSLALLGNLLNLKLKKTSNSFLNSINTKIKNALSNPLMSGLGVRNLEVWPSNEVKEAIILEKRIFDTVCDGKHPIVNNLEYLEILFAITKEVFIEKYGEYSTMILKSKVNDANLNISRIQLAVCITNCILIKSKITDDKIEDNFTLDFKQSTFITRLYNLRIEVTEFLEKNYNAFSLYPGISEKK